MPDGSSGQVFVEGDYMNQAHNLRGTRPAPADDNSDKLIRTAFLNVGLEYQVARDWSLMVEVPVTSRLFHTENDAGTAVDTFNHNALGDIRISGTWTGLSDDASTGLTFGIKLPTGDWKYAGFDRDVEIGSGSTDLLIGGYHRGAITRDGRWNYFVQVLAQLPVASQGGYRPAELGGRRGGRLSERRDDGRRQGGRHAGAAADRLGAGRDHGPAADPADSGYSRLLVSPGIEVTDGAWRVYGDVEMPVYQSVNGDQLVAPALYKVVVSRSF